MPTRVTGSFWFAVAVWLAVASCTSAPTTPQTAADGAPIASSDADATQPSGREALRAAQGRPHILWFWGAH